MHTSKNTANGTNRAARRSVARRGGAAGTGALLVTGSAAALLTAFAGSAGASTTITVDSNGDGVATATNCTDFVPGNCTLRDAALAALDGDTINFDASISLITLAGGTVETTAVNIIGPGASSLTITTTAAAGSYDLFSVEGIGDAVISGLTVTKNRIKSLNDGKFTLDGVTVSGSTGAYGGALYAGNDGELEIIDSTFENNTASTNGGAVYIYNDNDATISGSTFTNNESLADGGAIFGEIHYNVTIVDCTITGNSAADDGGGLAFYAKKPDNVLSITDTTIDANDAGDLGGGLKIDAQDPLIVSITNSTVSNNTAQTDAGILFDEGGITATINNSTISANAALYGSGGVYIGSGSSLTVNQSTISANSSAGSYTGTDGGGIQLGDNTSVVTLSGSIVSGNSSGVAGAADFGLYSSLASDTASITATNSLIGEVDSRITVNGTNNVSSTNPMLGALANNGGPTKTMALLTGSPAIDAGPNPVATFTGNEFDQRGAGYARVVGGLVDIGAFELQPSSEPIAPSFTG
ncbi:MAG: right-handed parallel beta-helix repeat-containing protein [Actinomycetia bacterium]|nr:right-handed parallel beta-helix repeat-containing protein [Actinomycetes bacterium]